MFCKMRASLRFEANLDRAVLIKRPGIVHWTLVVAEWAHEYPLVAP